MPAPEGDFEAALHELSERLFAASDYVAAFRQTSPPLPAANARILDKALLAVESACAAALRLGTGSG